VLNEFRDLFLAAISSVFGHAVLSS